MTTRSIFKGKRTPGGPGVLQVGTSGRAAGTNGGEVYLVAIDVPVGDGVALASAISVLDFSSVLASE